MRLLLLTDIHANRFGLEAVLADARGHYDQALCLGDVVGYGAHPNECCEILRDVKAWCLRGNHDAAAIEQLSIADFNPIASEAMLWTRRQLSIVNISWLESLKSRLDREEDDFQAVHGSVRDPLEEYILDMGTARASFALMNRSVCFYGHTHVAEFYSRPLEQGSLRPQNDDFLNGGQLEIQSQQQYLVNPGSCGQPRDGNPQARYALFDTVSRRLEVRALDYPVQAARDAILNAGLPPDLGDRLLVGE
ncbi:MAG TPA: metallophosphoesterase family protein [Abditibacteriaceae bacterium]|nr:metallophosphoesterase family protein [Abditibacteriaceae bacterium]